MLVPWEKNHDKARQSIKKLRVVKAVFSAVVLYWCESWNIKKAEHWRTDAFELWCWIRLLRFPWTARSNQSILNEINPEFHWKDWCWSSNTLATCCKKWTHWKTPWCSEIEGKRGRGRQTMSWLDSITDSRDVNLSKLQEILEDRGAWHAAVHGITKSQTRLSDWTTTVGTCCIAHGAQLSALWWPTGVGWVEGGSPRRRGYIYIYIADTLCFTAETNTIM